MLYYLIAKLQLIIHDNLGIYYTHSNQKTSLLALN